MDLPELCSLIVAVSLIPNGDHTIYLGSKPIRSCIMFKLTDYIPKAELETFCRRNHITKMSLFGSALRDELKPGSDIDILVEFDKNHIPGLLDLAGMEIELAEMFGRKVDLRTPAELSRYFRDEVLEKARMEYAI